MIVTEDWLVVYEATAAVGPYTLRTFVVGEDSAWVWIAVSCWVRRWSGPPCCRCPATRRPGRRRTTPLRRSSVVAAPCTWCPRRGPSSTAPNTRRSRCGRRHRCRRRLSSPSRRARRGSSRPWGCSATNRRSPTPRSHHQMKPVNHTSTRLSVSRRSRPLLLHLYTYIPWTNWNMFKQETRRRWANHSFYHLSTTTGTQWSCKVPRGENALGRGMCK